MGLALGCLQVEQLTITIRAFSIKIIAIREVFGKYENVLVPGCHYVPWCMGRQIAGYLSLHVQQLDLDFRYETKTKFCYLKLNFITKTKICITYALFLLDLLSLSDLIYYRLANTKEQIQAYVFDGVFL
jgi:hypothetical protein